MNINILFKAETTVLNARCVMVANYHFIATPFDMKMTVRKD